MTKLYGAEQRLFTAAEARRIDIERGGEGRIRHQMWPKENNYIILAEDFVERDNSQALGCKEWLPLTPAPEAEKESDGYCKGGSPDCFFAQNGETYCTVCKCFIGQGEKIKQLEKELAELKEKARWKWCHEEVPARTGGVYLKDDSQDSNDFLGLGYYNHMTDTFYYNLKGDLLPLNVSQIKSLLWKYEAEL